MTNDEIKAEVSLQLTTLYLHGNVRVVFGWPDEPAAEGGIRLETHESIDLDFTVTREHPGSKYGDGFTVFLNRIGNWSVLDALPRSQVVGDRRIPDHVFLAGDKFIADYNRGDAVVANYSLYSEICQQLKPKKIFEIGVRAGYSAWAMLHGCGAAGSAMTNASGRHPRGPDQYYYYGIDLDQGTAGGVSGYTDYARQMLASEFPDASIEIEIGDSQAMDAFPGHFDLVHIDGDHWHCETLHDLELAARHADWVLIDDVTHIATVGSAVVEFLERHPVPATFYDSWRGHVLMDTTSIGAGK
jgi:hypothetical protein